MNINAAKERVKARPTANNKTSEAAEQTTGWLGVRAKTVNCRYSYYLSANTIDITINLSSNFDCR